MQRLRVVLRAKVVLADLVEPRLGIRGLVAHDEVLDLPVDVAQLVGEHLQHLGDDAGVLHGQRLELRHGEGHHLESWSTDGGLLARVAAEGRLHAEELAGLDEVVDFLPGLDVDAVQTDLAGVQEEDPLARVTLEVR